MLFAVTCPSQVVNEATFVGLFMSLDGLRQEALSEETEMESDNREAADDDDYEGMFLNVFVVQSSNSYHRCDDDSRGP